MLHCSGATPHVFGDALGGLHARAVEQGVVWVQSGEHGDALRLVRHELAVVRRELFEQVSDLRVLDEVLAPATVRAAILRQPAPLQLVARDVLALGLQGLEAARERLVLHRLNQL